MKPIHATAFAAALAFAPEARAQDDQICMRETEVTAALVAEAGQYDWRGTEARGAAPAFLIGQLSPTRMDETIAEGAYGSVVFVRESGGGWRGFLPSPTESNVGAFAAPGSGAVIIVTMVQSEGPGQSWTLMRSENGLQSGSCVHIAFPAELNQPSWANEYVDLVDLDIRADGRGEILGTARVDRAGAEQVWHYLYRTRDGGSTWSKPQRLRRLREARAGLFDKIDDDAPPQSLIDAVTAYAAGS